MEEQGLQACNPETEAIGRRPRPLGGPIHIPLHIDQRLHFERTGCRGILQPPRRQRTDIRRHEQRVWVEQAAKIFHGRKHRIPSADCIDTQFLQRHNGKN